MDADGWQPIETAPKDWSNVILFCPDSAFNSDVMEGYYSCADGGDDCWKRADGNFMISPTRWQPLPNPPQE